METLTPTLLNDVKPSEFGIEENKALELISNLPQIVAERATLAIQYDEIVKMDIDSPLTVKKAIELRKLIKNNRTKGIEVWHKTAKDYFLKGGQFVDAIKRKEVAINERMEENLEQIEKHAERKEAKRKKLIADERLTELNKYEFQLSAGIDLGSMDEAMYQNLLAGCKSTYEAKIEAERIAEEERIENLRLDKIATERRIEIAPYAQFMTEQVDLKKVSDSDYEKLVIALKETKKQYDAHQAEIKAENERLRLAKEEADAKAEADRKEAQRLLDEANAKAKAEREKAEKEANEKLEAEKAERLKAQQELADKLAKEAQEKADAEARAEAELSKGDADKYNDLLKDLEDLKTKYTFKSKKFKDAYDDCGTLLTKTIAHLNSKK